jgi:hypothetical protein
MRRVAFAMAVVSGLLAFCTAGIMRADLDATAAARTALDTGKELAHLTPVEYLGVTVIVLAIALILLSLIFFKLLKEVGSKIAQELAVLSAERQRSTEAREFCERHSGLLQARIDSKEKLR